MFLCLWDLQYAQEKIKARLMQNCGGQTKLIYYPSFENGL